MRKIITIHEAPKGCWRLAFDGRVLGDSRGFDKARAWAEARKEITIDERDAIRFDRPLMYVLGTAETSGRI